MWKYTHNDMLGRILYPCIYFLQFLLELSWLYAHYRNGSFPYQYPDKPRLTFKNWTFFQCVKESWRSRKGEY